MHTISCPYAYGLQVRSIRESVSRCALRWPRYFTCITWRTPRGARRAWCPVGAHLAWRGPSVGCESFRRARFLPATGRITTTRQGKYGRVLISSSTDSAVYRTHLSTRRVHSPPSSKFVSILRTPIYCSLSFSFIGRLLSRDRVCVLCRQVTKPTGMGYD